MKIKGRKERLETVHRSGAGPGWMNYYSHFYQSALYRLYDHIDQKLVRWAQRKYRKLAGKPARARAWLTKVVGRQPRLFVHWLGYGRVAVRTMGAV